MKIDGQVVLGFEEDANIIGRSHITGGGSDSNSHVWPDANDVILIAARIEELQAFLVELHEMLHGDRPLTGFFRNLKIGASGNDVRELQRFLNDHGFTVSPSGAGLPGSESDYFGDLTREALAPFQARSGIVPAVGYFGAVTRTLVNELLES